MLGWNKNMAGLGPKIFFVSFLHFPLSEQQSWVLDIRCWFLSCTSWSNHKQPFHCHNKGLLDRFLSRKSLPAPHLLSVPKRHSVVMSSAIKLLLHCFSCLKRKACLRITSQITPPSLHFVVLMLLLFEKERSIFCPCLTVISSREKSPILHGRSVDRCSLKN